MESDLKDSKQPKEQRIIDQDKDLLASPHSNTAGYINITEQAGMTIQIPRARTETLCDESDAEEPIDSKVRGGSLHQKTTASGERQVRKRIMDAKYARQRRKREKSQESYLQKKFSDLTQMNIKLEVETKRLERLLEESRQIVSKIEALSIATGSSINWPSNNYAEGSSSFPPFPITDTRLDRNMLLHSNENSALHQSHQTLNSTLFRTSTPRSGDYKERDSISLGFNHTSGRGRIPPLLSSLHGIGSSSIDSMFTQLQSLEDLQRSSRLPTTMNQAGPEEGFYRSGAQSIFAQLPQRSIPFDALLSAYHQSYRDDVARQQLDSLNVQQLISSIQLANTIQFPYLPAGPQREQQLSTTTGQLYRNQMAIMLQDSEVANVQAIGASTILDSNFATQQSIQSRRNESDGNLPNEEEIRRFYESHFSRNGG